MTEFLRRFLESAVIGCITQTVSSALTKIGGDQVDYYWLHREEQFLVDHPGRKEIGFVNYWVTDREGGCKKDAAMRKQLRDAMREKYRKSQEEFINQVA